ncbi:hypothetical protein NFI96_013639, partial [Prochilodus magdalenae]
DATHPLTERDKMWLAVLFAWSSLLPLAAPEGCPEASEDSSSWVRLKPLGHCRDGENTCPYRITLPPLTIQLPKPFRDLEKMARDLQSLTQMVNQLKADCRECKERQRIEWSLYTTDGKEDGERIQASRGSINTKEREQDLHKGAKVVQGSPPKTEEEEFIIRGTKQTDTTGMEKQRWTTSREKNLNPSGIRYRDESSGRPKGSNTTHTERKIERTSKVRELSLSDGEKGKELHSPRDKLAEPSVSGNPDEEQPSQGFKGSVNTRERQPDLPRRVKVVQVTPLITDGDTVLTSSGTKQVNPAGIEKQKWNSSLERNLNPSSIRHGAEASGGPEGSNPEHMERRADGMSKVKEPGLFSAAENTEKLQSSKRKQIESSLLENPDEQPTQASSSTVNTREKQQAIAKRMKVYQGTGQETEEEDTVLIGSGAKEGSPVNMEKPRWSTIRERNLNQSRAGNKEVTSGGPKESNPEHRESITDSRGKVAGPHLFSATEDKKEIQSPRAKQIESSLLGNQDEKQSTQASNGTVNTRDRQQDIAKGVQVYPGIEGKETGTKEGSPVKKKHHWLIKEVTSGWGQKKEVQDRQQDIAKGVQVYPGIVQETEEEDTVLIGSGTKEGSPVNMEKPRWSTSRERNLNQSSAGNKEVTSGGPKESNPEHRQPITDSRGKVAEPRLFSATEDKEEVQSPRAKQTESSLLGNQDEKQPTQAPSGTVNTRERQQDIAKRVQVGQGTTRETEEEGTVLSRIGTKEGSPVNMEKPKWSTIRERNLNQSSAGNKEVTRERQQDIAKSVQVSQGTTEEPQEEDTVLIKSGIQQVSPTGMEKQRWSPIREGSLKPSSTGHTEDTSEKINGSTPVHTERTIGSLSKVIKPESLSSRERDKEPQSQRDKQVESSLLRNQYEKQTTQASSDTASTRERPQDVSKRVKTVQGTTQKTDEDTSSTRQEPAERGKGLESPRAKQTGALVPGNKGMVQPTLASSNTRGGQEDIAKRVFQGVEKQSWNTSQVSKLDPSSTRRSGESNPVHMDRETEGMSKAREVHSLTSSAGNQDGKIENNPEIRGVTLAPENTAKTNQVNPPNEDKPIKRFMGLPRLRDTKEIKLNPNTDDRFENSSDVTQSSRVGDGTVKSGSKGSTSISMSPNERRPHITDITGKTAENNREFKLNVTELTKTILDRHGEEKEEDTALNSSRRAENEARNGNSEYLLNPGTHAESDTRTDSAPPNTVEPVTGSERAGLPVSIEPDGSGTNPQRLHKNDALSEGQPKPDLKTTRPSGEEIKAESQRKDTLGNSKTTSVRTGPLKQTPTAIDKSPVRSVSRPRTHAVGPNMRPRPTGLTSMRSHGVDPHPVNSTKYKERAKELNQPNLSPQKEFESSTVEALNSPANHQIQTTPLNTETKRFHAVEPENPGGKRELDPITDSVREHAGVEKTESADGRKGANPFAARGVNSKQENYKKFLRAGAVHNSSGKIQPTVEERTGKVQGRSSTVTASTPNSVDRARSPKPVVMPKRVKSTARPRASPPSTYSTPHAHHEMSKSVESSNGNPYPVAVDRPENQLLSTCHGQCDPEPTLQPILDIRKPSENSREEPPQDCSDLLLKKLKSGVYSVTPAGSKNSTFRVFCDMEASGGGWTLIQNRFDGSISFNRSWVDYRRGFGNLTGEFWLGNDKIHWLTSAKAMVLRIELEDLDGVKEFAQYDRFHVANENQRYRLTIGGYTGTAGDALQFSKKFNHDQKDFSTPDRDNDRYPSGNCGAYYSSGWWFDACMAANLNGNYYQARYRGVRNGIFWGTWHNISTEYYPTNDRQAFKTVRMMVRPRIATDRDY